MYFLTGGRSLAVFISGVVLSVLVIAYCVLSSPPIEKKFYNVGVLQCLETSTLSIFDFYVCIVDYDICILSVFKCGQNVERKCRLKNKIHPILLGNT